MPSLYGSFPDSLRCELQGFVSDLDWEEGRNRPALEYAKIAHNPSMAGFTEEDFRWAFSVRPFKHLLRFSYVPCLTGGSIHGLTQSKGCTRACIACRALYPLTAQHSRALVRPPADPSPRECIDTVEYRACIVEVQAAACMPFRWFAQGQSRQRRSQ